MALKKFEGLQTEWGGLWYNSATRSYKSTNISFALLRQFKGNVSLIVRNNRYYVKDSGRPNLVFTLRDTKGEENIELKAQSIKQMPYYDYATGNYYNENDEKLFTEAEVLSMLEQMKSDFMFGESPDDCVPSFYVK